MQIYGVFYTMAPRDGLELFCNHLNLLSKYKKDSNLTQFLTQY